MNIETANRLYEYRKKMKLSQEELANKIGVSRQAVSKWERSEASPDTDNLIALSKVYGVSLDELIMGKENKSEAHKKQEEAKEAPAEKIKEETETEANESIDIADEVINTTDEIIDESLNAIKSDNEYDDEEEDGNNRNRLKKMLYSFPYPVLATIVFFIYGFTGIGGGWVYGWLIFLTIPLYYTFIPAYFNKNPTVFCYPVLVVWIYMYLGFRFSLWHPMWLLFLTIPLYYSICSNLRRK